MVCTGGAWLSSARAVRRRVQSRNERNPRGLLKLLVTNNTSAQTAGEKPEEGGDDVKSACPLRPGRLTCYNGRDNEMLPCVTNTQRRMPTSQTRPQFGLQAATRLHEGGIASNRRSATRR